MNGFFNQVKDQFSGLYDQIIVLSPKILFGVILLFFFIFLSRRMAKGVKSILAERSDDPILNSFLTSITSLILVLIGILSFLQIVGLGKLVTSILATAGISAFVVGFAFKDIVENFLAGMIMAFNRPFKLGDIIQVKGFKGKIVRLGFRETQIKSSEGIDVYIPNALMLKNPLENFTIDGFIRYEFTLKVGTHENIDKIDELIMNTLKETKGILFDSRMPTVGIQNNLGDKFEISVHYWRDTLDSNIPSYQARSKVLRTITEKLSQEGIALL